MIDLDTKNDGNNHKIMTHESQETPRKVINIDSHVQILACPRGGSSGSARRLAGGEEGQGGLAE